MISTKKTVEYLTLALTIFCLLGFNFQTSAIEMINVDPEEYYIFNDVFVNGSIFEWTIRNVQFNSEIDEITFSNNDILTVELAIDIDKDSCEFLTTASPLVFFPQTLYYADMSINGEDVEGDTWELFLRGYDSFCCGLTSYQFVFDLSNPISISLPEPWFFYPLEFVNGSTTISYFDLFYDYMSQKADQMSKATVTKSEDEKFLDIEFSQSTENPDYKRTSKQILSLNMEIGIVGFYSVDYNYTDKLNNTKSESFTYELFSEKYGSAVYKTGLDPLSFILITATSIFCITYLLKRRKNNN